MKPSCTGVHEAAVPDRLGPAALCAEWRDVQPEAWELFSSMGQAPGHARGSQTSVFLGTRAVLPAATGSCALRLLGECTQASLSLGSGSRVSLSPAVAAFPACVRGLRPST